MAEGLLLIMVNDATKFSDNLMKHDKTYYVSLEFGYETNTYDLEGEITNKYTSNMDISLDKILKILDKFKGKIMQVPPMYSALKLNGRKLCDLAREGINLDLPAREVQIYDIYDVFLNEKFLSFRVSVSSGTYIRSLVRDIGREIGYFATMTKLVREKIDEFSLKDINKAISIENFFDYPKINVDFKTAKFLKNGMTKIISLNFNCNIHDILKVYCNNEFCGFVEITKIKGYNIYIKRYKYFKIKECFLYDNYRE